MATSRENSAVLRNTQYQFKPVNFLHKRKQMHDFKPHLMCSHIPYSYYEQGAVPHAGRRGRESPIYRTHAKQMLLSFAIDPSKRYMSDMDDTIRLSHLSPAFLQKDIGMPPPFPINTD